MTLTRSRLRSEIDALLADIKARQQVIVNHTELWGEGLQVDPQAQGYLACLLDIGDHRVCASPGLHRESWRYAGEGYYICETCRRIAV